jgi:hypothetical protein
MDPNPPEPRMVCRKLFETMLICVNKDGIGKCSNDIFAYVQCQDKYFVSFSPPPIFIVAAFSCHILAFASLSNSRLSAFNVQKLQSYLRAQHGVKSTKFSIQPNSPSPLPAQAQAPPLPTHTPAQSLSSQPSSNDRKPPQQSNKTVTSEEADNKKEKKDEDAKTDQWFKINVDRKVPGTTTLELHAGEH